MPSQGCCERSREGGGHPAGPNDRGQPPSRTLPPWHSRPSCELVQPCLPLPRAVQKTFLVAPPPPLPEGSPALQRDLQSFSGPCTQGVLDAWTPLGAFQSLDLGITFEWAHEVRLGEAVATLPPRGE